MSDNMITLTREIRHQAAMTALELVELTRYASRTGNIDASCVSVNDPQAITLGICCALEAACAVAGGGDLQAGVARVREVLKSLIIRQAEENADE